MGNSPKLGKPLIPAGDYGLGLCVQCLGEVILNPDSAPQPQFAICLAPLPQPGGVIASGACFEHLKQSAHGQAPALMVARGSLPK